MRPTTHTSGRATGREVLTLAALLIAPVLLIFPLSVFGDGFGWIVGSALGWVVGLALLWTSGSWTVREKAVASLVWPCGLAPALLLATTVGEVCERAVGGAETCVGSSLPVWLGIPTMVVAAVAPVLVTVWMLSHTGRPREAAHSDGADRS
jgi:hypothetical protein